MVTTMIMDEPSHIVLVFSLFFFSSKMWWRNEVHKPFQCDRSNREKWNNLVHRMNAHKDRAVFSKNIKFPLIRDDWTFKIMIYSRHISCIHLTSSRMQFYLFNHFEITFPVQCDANWITIKWIQWCSMKSIIHEKQNYSF